MSDREDEFEVLVSAFGLDGAASEALFDRVTDAAHALDEQVLCVGSTSPTAGERAFTDDELRAHDDRIRAEALAPVLALADECERLDAYLSHDVTDLTSPMGWRGVNRPAWEVIRTAAALRVAAGTPTHHTTEEDTP